MSKESSSKRTLYAIIIALVIVSLIFHWLLNNGLEQTSLLFIGIPTILSLLLVKYTDTPKRASAIVFYSITLFLLLAAILFGEGLICIIFMAPLFYGVGAFILFIKSFFDKRKKSKLNMVIILPLLFLIAQPNEINQIPPVNHVMTSILIPGQAELSQLNKTPDLADNLPSFLKMGFPKPVSVNGSGIHLGDIRNIGFKSSTKGVGYLRLRIKQVNDTQLTFEIVEDNSHIAHWLSYKSIQINLKPMGNNTQVTWRTSFTCDLGPSWYFKPFEKMAIDMMNAHLINSFFNQS